MSATRRLDVGLGVVLALALAAPAAAMTPAMCTRASGDAASRCLAAYVKAKAAGRDVKPLLEAVAPAVEKACVDETTRAIGYFGLADASLRMRDACADFGDALVGLAKPEGAATSGSAGRCSRVVAGALSRLRSQTIAIFGKACFLREADGHRCRRPARDRRAASVTKQVRGKIQRGCGSGLAALGVGSASNVADTAADLMRHFAQFVYPPNDLGPTADFGPFPVGVRTLTLFDPQRPDKAGTGPRPVTVEVWYPSTAEAIAGVPRYVVNLFGLDIAATPSYRDVAHAPGPFPVVLFSHGNNGIRFQSIFLATHLASHGYIVASPDHYGNTFLDAFAGFVAPPAQVAVDRPIDMSFVLDQLIAFNADPASFFAGTVDADRIGMSGHSFGGYTTFALAGGTSPIGTFTDRRMRAFLPLAPADLFPPEFFATITQPILIVGGTLDTTTPFAANQETPFTNLPSGAGIVGLAELTGAGHFTFSDICEVPRNLVGAIGGFDEACTPAHLPWHDAHDIVNYLALNFFDATLRSDTAARTRLAPVNLKGLDDLVYVAK